MFVFRNTFTDRKGKKREAAKWYCDFTAAAGTRCRLPAFTDHKASEALGRRIDRLVACRASGESLPLDIQRWLEGLPDAIRGALHKFGLLDGVRVAAGKTITEHLADWKAYLESKGNTKEHADKSRSRAEKITTGCKFTFHGDISAAKAAAFLHNLNVGKSTYNHYLTALKGFCSWMCKDGRATSNPVAYLAKVNAATDVRRERRVLAVDEIELLLTTTEAEPTRHGLTGGERSLLYRLALATGLRVSELASLRRESFDMSLSPPVVTVAAGYSKRGRQDTLPLSDSIAGVLRPFLATLARGQRLFAMHKFPRTAEMLAADLEAARAKWIAQANDNQRVTREETDFLLYLDSSGRYADFHATRHSFISHLAAAGVHPRVAQSLARHSDINLTMSRYSHVLSGQEADAVDKLPAFGEQKNKARRAQATA